MSPIILPYDSKNFHVLIVTWKKVPSCTSTWIHNNRYAQAAVAAHPAIASDAEGGMSDPFSHPVYNVPQSVAIV